MGDYIVEVIENQPRYIEVDDGLQDIVDVIVIQDDVNVEISTSNTFISFNLPSGYPIVSTSGSLPFNRLENYDTIVRTINNQSISGVKTFNENIAILSPEFSGPVSHIAVFNENISPGLSPGYVKSISIPNFKSSLGLSISDLSPTSSNSLISNITDEIGTGRLVFNNDPIFSGNLISSGVTALKVSPSLFAATYFPIFVSDPSTFARTIFTRTTSQVKSDLGLNNVQNLSLSGITFTAGSGLVGGGNLSSSRTFDIGKGDGINVTSDAIAVDNSVVRTTGNQSISGIKSFNGTFKSAGFDDGTNISYNVLFTPSQIIIGGGDIPVYLGGMAYYDHNGEYGPTKEIVNKEFLADGYSPIGHTHTSSSITNFNSSVSGLLPVTSLSGISGVLVTNNGSNYLVSLNDPTIQLNDITDLSSNARNFLLSSTSSNFRTLVTDETGSGSLVFNDSPTFVGIPLVPTASSGTNTQQIASTSFVRTEISNLVNSAPSTLDTLNELATALGNDPNFATTVTNNLAGKANLSGATFTGSISGPSGNFTSLKTNNIDVSVSGHTHNLIDIIDFPNNLVYTSGDQNINGNLIISGSGIFNSLTAIGYPIENSYYTEKLPGIIYANTLILDRYVAPGPQDGPAGSIEFITNAPSTITLKPSDFDNTGGIYLFPQSGGGTLSIEGHTHVSSNITDFNNSVSGLLPVKNIIGGSGIQVGSNSGEYTITAYGVAAASASALTTLCDNKTGSTIPKMTAVYINGGHGNRPTIQKAIALNEAGSSKTYGLTTTNIDNDQSGDVIVVGELIDVNTQQFGVVEGTTLYLSPLVSGALTTTKPLAPYHLVSVGKIVRNHLTQGIIAVTIQNGFELGELHNVSTDSAGDNGKFLQYNSSSGLWLPSVSGNFSTLSVNGTGVSVSGHSHVSSDITNFNSSVSGLLSTISNSGDNRVLTSTGSSVGMNAESNLTFDGNLLNVVGSGAFSSGLNIANQIASRIASFDSNKNIISLDTTIYPSLTELAYVKGTTSSIQNQLNSSTIVRTTGNQTITGNKIFSNTTTTLFEDGSYLSYNVSSPEYAVDILTESFPWVFRARDLNNGTELSVGNPTNGDNDITISTIDDIHINYSAINFNGQSLFQAAIGDGANGQLLIGNGSSFAKSTLTAGTGISITNGSGTIRIDSNIADPVTGTGVANHVAYWNSSSGIVADSGQLYWNATNNRLGVGTSSPSVSLEVGGSIRQTWLGTDLQSAMIYDNSYRMGINYFANQRILNLFSTSNDSGGHLTFSTRLDAGSSSTDYGTERMRITSSGNIGIGTASPSARLEVAASATTSVDIAHFSNSNGMEKAKFSLSSNGDGTLSLIDGNNVTNAFLSSNSTSSSYVNGKFGIGTTTPSSQLHVVGTGTFDNSIRLGSSSTSGTIIGLSTSGTIPAIIFDTVGNNHGNQQALYDFRENGVSFISIDGAGNLQANAGNIVGVATNPSTDTGSFIGHGMRRRLTSAGMEFVWGESITSVSEPGIDLFPVGGTHISSGILFRLSKDSNKTDVALIVNGSGNVGIGTSTPSGQLHVIGNGLFSGDVTASSIIGSSGTSSLPSFEFINDTDTGLFSPSANTIGVSTSGVERLRVNSSGYIGINNTNPQYALDVNGNVNIDGNLTFDSFTESVVAIGNSSTSQTLSLTSGTVQTCTLTGNCTFTMPTATAGKSFTMFLNTGSGNYTASFSGVRWADSATPTATILANKVDIYSFISDGSFWYGSFSQNYG